jgi:hypothetical protein
VDNRSNGPANSGDLDKILEIETEDSWGARVRTMIRVTIVTRVTRKFDAALCAPALCPYHIKDTNKINHP